MPDILNCPCCDAKARFVDYGGRVLDTIKAVKHLVRFGYVQCDKCGLRTRVNTFGRVLKTWNRRDLVNTLKAKGMGDFGADGFLNEKEIR